MPRNPESVPYKEEIKGGNEGDENKEIKEQEGEEWITFTEAAGLAEISTDQLHFLAKEGHLKKTKNITAENNGQIVTFLSKNELAAYAESDEFKKLFPWTQEREKNIHYNLHFGEAGGKRFWFIQHPTDDMRMNAPYIKFSYPIEAPSMKAAEDIVASRFHLKAWELEGAIVDKESLK